MREKAAVAAMVLGLFGVSHTASAIELDINYETLASGTVIYTPTPNTLETANHFGRSFTEPTPTIAGTGPGTGLPAEGFYDAFVFSVPDSTVDSVTTSIDLGTFSQISNLQVRLFDFSLNPTPNEPNPLVGPVYDATWTHVGGVTVDVLGPTMLAPGTYVLEVRGDVTGSSGSYGGTLNFAPVPVPAALPLLLSGLGALGAAMRRRERRAA